MRIAIDKVVPDRFSLVDEQSPISNSIMFDYFPKEDRVAVCQDSEDYLLSHKFDAIHESVDFKRSELIEGLKNIIEILEGFNDGN